MHEQVLLNMTHIFLAITNRNGNVVESGRERVREKAEQDFDVPTRKLQTCKPCSATTISMLNSYY